MRMISVLSLAGLTAYANHAYAAVEQPIENLNPTMVIAIVGVLLIAALVLHWQSSRALKQKNLKLQQNIERQQAAIEQLTTQKERLFANISQEIKSPLTLILNPLEAIDETQSKEIILEKVALIKRNGHHLLRIVEQLLELSQLRVAGSKQWHHYSLTDTLNLLLASFQPIYDSKQITLKVMPFEDVILRLKSNSLELILTNLISNAIKYTNEHGSITISVQADSEDQQAAISISDTGTGIDQSIQEQMFNPFTWDESRPNSISGSGIGLALVKELVEANQGQIALKSEQNVGSTFTLTLPLADTDQTQIQALEALSESSRLEIQFLDEIESTQAVNVAAMHQDESQPLVLLIDDNKDMLKLLQGILVPHFRCMLAINGTSGLAKAQEYLPDLVICDVMMPGIDGFEVLCELKTNPLTCHIPVVLLTARADVQSRIRGWESNADEYIEKPFHVDELLSRVESLMAVRQLLHGRYQQEFNRLEDDSDEQQSPCAEALDKDDEQMLDCVNERFIQQLNGAIEKHFSDESFDVGLLADELAMSNRQLHRKTKSILDLTPKESIRHFRLKRAAELLKQGIPAGEVAFKVGFSSHSYFSQCFKAQFNCSPSAFI